MNDFPEQPVIFSAATRPPWPHSADEDQAEIERLSRALEVCAYVLHRRNPTPAEIHAGQTASAAWYIEDWRPGWVHDDIPEFLYEREKALSGLADEGPTRVRRERP